MGKWDLGYDRSMGNYVKPKRDSSPMSIASGCCTNSGKKQGGAQARSAGEGVKAYRPPSKRPTPKA